MSERVDRIHEWFNLWVVVYFLEHNEPPPQGLLIDKWEAMLAVINKTP